MYIQEREISYFRHGLLEFGNYVKTYEELLYLKDVNDNYIFNYYLDQMRLNPRISFKDANFSTPEHMSFVENLKYQAVC